MTELLRELQARGVRLRLDGDGLAFTAPKGAMTPELLRAMRERKDDLRDWLLLEQRGVVGVPTVFDPERMMAAAAEAEGTDDYGPEAGALREALGVYAESVERDAQPHGLGRIYLWERIFRMSLVARLRLAPHLRPGARPVRAPLVVCGLPRSGTTLLHRLLALADDAAGLPLWQLLEPIPPRRGPDERRAHAERNIAWLGGLVPVSLDAQHYVRPDLADECAHLLRTAFVGSMPWQAPAYGWLDWTLGADVGPAYRVWAALLARLEPDGARLVLKDPFHAGWLDALLAACPDAMVVQTHRDPVEVVPSFHKLCTTMHAVLTPRPDVPRTVAANTRWLAWTADRMRPTGVQVAYRDLVRDPVAEVARIHAAYGLPLTEGHVARMRVFLAENAQRRHGGNEYSLAQFGQREEEIVERFSAYRERFGHVG